MNKILDVIALVIIALVFLSVILIPLGYAMMHTDNEVKYMLFVFILMVWAVFRAISTLDKPH